MTGFLEVQHITGWTDNSPGVLYKVGQDFLFVDGGLQGAAVGATPHEWPA